MAEEETPAPRPRKHLVSIRGAGDVILFAIGAAGAAWELFVNSSSNPYVYALIFALLRLGSSALDKIEDLVNVRKR